MQDKQHTVSGRTHRPAPSSPHATHTYSLDMLRAELRTVSAGNGLGSLGSHPCTVASRAVDVIDVGRASFANPAVAARRYQVAGLIHLAAPDFEFDLAVLSVGTDDRQA